MLGLIASASSSLRARLPRTFHQACPPSSSTCRSAPVSLVLRPAQRTVLQSTGNLRGNKGARRSKTRYGRGEGAKTGEGKGRGTKGQNARGGKPPTRAFEGGQTPVTQQYPKRGFFSFNKKYYQPLSLGTLQEYIDLRRIDATEPITVEHIHKSNLVHGWKQANGFKLLAKGFTKLKQPIHIRPHRASAQAIRAIEAAGGSVTCIYHNRLSFRQAIMPEKFLGHLRVKEALPMKKRDILYYTNWEKRGYLAKKPEEVEEPSRVVPAAAPAATQGRRRPKTALKIGHEM